MHYTILERSGTLASPGVSAQRRPSLSLSLARPRSCASRLTKHPRVLTSSGHWWSADNSIPPKARVQFASASTPFREIVYSSPTIGWPPPSPPLIAAAVGGFSRVPGLSPPPASPPLPSFCCCYSSSSKQAVASITASLSFPIPPIFTSLFFCLRKFLRILYLLLHTLLEKGLALPSCSSRPRCRSSRR